MPARASASAKPSTWLPLSPMNTRGRPAQRGGCTAGSRRSARQTPERERRATKWLGCTVKASIAKNAQAIAASVAASPSMLSSRLNAFVIPTSQTTPSDRREDVVADDLDADARRRARARRRRPARELGERRQVEDVVEQAGEEEDRAAAEDPAELRRRRGRRRSRAATPTATSRPAKIPTPPSSGVERVCQRSALRCGHDVARRRGVQEPPDRQEARRQRGEGSHGDRHGRQA